MMSLANPDQVFKSHGLTLNTQVTDLSWAAVEWHLDGRRHDIAGQAAETMVSPAIADHDGRGDRL